MTRKEYYVPYNYLFKENLSNKSLTRYIVKDIPNTLVDYKQPCSVFDTYSKDREIKLTELLNFKKEEDFEEISCYINDIDNIYIISDILEVPKDRIISDYLKTILLGFAIRINKQGPNVHIKR